MYTLNTFLVGHELRLSETQILASGSVAFDKVHFDFDDSWEGLSKVALFWGADGNAYGAMVDAEGNAVVPWEALATGGRIKFGVYGVTGSGDNAVRATSTLIYYKLPEGAWTEDGQQPTPAEQTIIEQAIAAIQSAVENLDREPIIRDGIWYTWDINVNDYVSTGVSAIGPAAGFGSVSATVDDNTGTPSVEITSSGPDTAKNFSFAFHNLKGPTGDVTPAAQQAASDAQAAAQAAAGSAQAAAGSEREAEDTAAEIKQKLDSASAYGEVGPVPIAAISDALPLNADKLVVDIEPVQAGSGDQSPDNERPISGWTGANVTVNEDVLDITFPSEAGTVYGGTLDVVNGVLTVDRYTHVYEGATDDVITARSYDTNNKCLSIRVAAKYHHIITTNGPHGVTLIQPMCDILPINTFDNLRNNTGNAFAAQGNWASALAIQVSGLTTVAEYDAWCAEHKPQISWKLATPITYQLTPQQITMLQGENNVWADCGDTTLGYWRDDSLSINKAISERMPDITPLQSGLSATQSSIAIIVSGDSASMAVPVGGYAYIKDNTHGLAEGLYTNTSSAAFPTVGGTADSTVFTAVSGGGLNELNSNLNNKSQLITIAATITYDSAGLFTIPTNAFPDNLMHRVVSIETVSWPSYAIAMGGPGQNGAQGKFVGVSSAGAISCLVTYIK